MVDNLVDISLSMPYNNNNETIKSERKGFKKNQKDNYVQCRIRFCKTRLR